MEDGKKVLALDGQQKILIPSSPELDLREGFSIELKLRIDDMSRGQTLAFKDGQYICPH